MHVCTTYNKVYSEIFFVFKLAAEEQELKELMAIQELLADEDEDEFNVSHQQIIYEWHREKTCFFA